MKPNHNLIGARTQLEASVQAAQQTTLVRHLMRQYEAHTQTDEALMHAEIKRLTLRAVNQKLRVKFPRHRLEGKNNEARDTGSVRSAQDEGAAVR